MRVFGYVLLHYFDLKYFYTKVYVLVLYIFYENTKLQFVFCRPHFSFFATNPNVHRDVLMFLFRDKINENASDDDSDSSYFLKGFFLTLL